jgi:hypothetical protein
MSRGVKSTVVVFRCTTKGCNRAVQTIHTNKRKNPKPTRSKFCNGCRKVVKLKAKDEVK